jgi:hypothetical protein
MRNRAAWSAVFGVFGAAAVAVAVPVWQAAKAAHSHTPFWPAVALAVIAVLSLYSMAATLLGWWPFRGAEVVSKDSPLIAGSDRAVDPRTGLSTPAEETTGPLIPISPRPYFPHTFPLQANTSGRSAERARLTAWLSGGGPALLVLVSLGGMGKSTLAWTWLQEEIAQSDTLSHDVSPEASQSRAAARSFGVMWWSFQESDGSFEHFLREALAYTDGRGVPRDSMPPPGDSIAQLLSNLRTGRFLLVLDGFEGQLIAHAPLGAPDTDATSDSPVPDRDRQCASPLLAKSLRDFQSVPGSSRVLLTTTLFPRDLDDLAGTARDDLGAMSLSDAIAFLELQGVKGASAEIAGVCKEYGCHPLRARR